MRFIYVAAASLLAAVSSANPLMVFHERQAPGSYYAITGPKGGVQPRLEIRQLQKTGEMWNLFLLAMEEFQAMDQTKIDSYYQIAGIHGLPWYDWDGVPKNPGIKRPTGYCPHANPLFAIWHRPYILLFEQKLQAIAIDIANRFTTNKAKYQDAANKLRLPYWDWAKAIPANEPVFPTAFATEKIEVTRPDGSKAQVDNPLFSYKFHPFDKTEINPEGCKNAPNPPQNNLKVCTDNTKTVRKADNAARNVSNHVALEATFRSALGSIRYSLYPVLSQWQPFDSFANAGRCGRSNSSPHLEGPHNTIHSEMGPGHMVPPAVSAFDPVFWSHHANVDRYVAIWQAIFPDTYVQGCPADTETWTIKEGDMLGVNSPLTPFHKNSAGDFWTSANSRYIEDLGYTYPELAGKPSNATLVAEVIRQYGPANGNAAKTKRQEEGPTKTQAYLTEVQMPKGDPYSVYIYLGDNLAGLTSTLGTENNDHELVMTEVTAALGEKISGGETTEQDAVEYLKANLKWKLVSNGEEIPRDKMPGIKVSLISTDVEKSNSDSEFDRWVGGFKQHGEIDP